ncbi:MAG: protein TolR [Gammaproteobacteria bacterium HGW-Gammaproteobacteria-14]|nr:MAG: protein TolR [Gammaproteobacteria bacterium HGW-Gammaproteobacteria-14]
MSMKVRSPRKMMADINVVPYIDVMLVLLVVFMITAPMMTQGINVDLPKTSSAAIDSKDQEPVILSIKKDGSYFVNVGDDQKKSASLDTVRGHVLRIYRNKPETLFLVEGDAEVPYGKVVSLMAALQGVGVEKIGLVTEPPQQ